MSKIVCLRTIRIAERPNLIWVEVETDEGLTGPGRIVPRRQATEAVIHEQIAPWLIGRDARRIEAVSRHLHDALSRLSQRGRGNPRRQRDRHRAVGPRGQTTRHPRARGSWRRGPQRNPRLQHLRRLRLQHQRRGPASGRRRRGNTVGPYDDQIAFMRDAGALAESLLEEGFTAMKIWPFDVYAEAERRAVDHVDRPEGGARAVPKDARGGRRRIEVMCELHSLWNTTSAIRICRALEDYGVLWAEDPITKMDDVAALADLRPADPHADLRQRDPGRRGAVPRSAGGGRASISSCSTWPGAAA